MGFAPELLKFFWPLNQPLDAGRVTQKPLSVIDFIQQHSITGDAVFDVLRIVNVLTNEKLLVPFVNQGGPFGQTFYSLSNPTNDQIAYGTFDCLALGFVFIRENFERSVIPLIFNTTEREAVGTGFLVAKNSILTARHCIDESLSMRIPGLSLSTLRSIKVPGEKLNMMDVTLLTFQDELVPSARPLRFGQANLLDDVMVMGYPPIKQWGTGVKPKR
jgi:trypsin-like peptidase